MCFSYIIIDDDNRYTAEIQENFNYFPNYICAGIFNDSQTTLQHIITIKPHLVFIEIPENPDQNKALFATISESFQFLATMPYFVALSGTSAHTLAAIQSGFSDYLLQSFPLQEFGKMLFKFEKRTPDQLFSNICIKSYSDYQFVDLKDIVYLKADNNTTDIQMCNGKIVNAYKTLKHFESSLPFFFLRIHKSYIVNIFHVSRINFGKSKCFLNYNETIPFSLHYKYNVEIIVNKMNL